MHIPQEDLEFYNLISPTFNGIKFPMPPPKLTPAERRQRRMAFRNERHLYYRNCDLTGKKILSAYSPDKEYKVYHFKEWASDKWNPMDYGMEPNFQRSFFEQFAELSKKVPVRSLNISSDMENCDFCNYGGSSKNCYLCIAPFQSQDCYYSRIPYACTYDIDGFANIQCQYTYESIACEGCYECFFSEYSKGCSESAFLLDCISCKNCFGCVGLKQQEYCFLNKKYSPEEYAKKVEGILSDRQKLNEFIEYFRSFSLKFPRKYSRNFQAENCTGDLIRNAKNCKDSFDLFYQEDSRYCELGGAQTHHAYDCTITGVNVVNCYEHIGATSCNNTAFGVYVTGNQNSYYLMNCENCIDCFGCNGLNRKQYCIFNKQYTAEEYHKTVAKIVEKMISDGEWGEFFPMAISPFAYNETLAHDYFTLTQQEVEAKGLQWKPENKQYDANPNLLRCKTTGQPFQVIKQEEDFLKKYGIAFPDKAPQVRYLDRLKSMNPYQLWERTCPDGTVVQSPYSPDRPEIILSEKAYQDYDFLLR